MVERSIKDRVLSGLVEEVKARRLGDPLDEGTTMGALVNEDQMNRVLGFHSLGSPLLDLPGVMLQSLTFTVMRHLAASNEVERIYSSNPAAYPVGGRKQKQGTSWVRSF